MQVDGDLIQLPECGNVLPLPWHCRAPLGLKSGSEVHVALVDSAQSEPSGSASHWQRRSPTLVASVLDPRSWNQTYWLTSEGPDRVGILSTILGRIRDWNEGRLNGQANPQQPFDQLNVVLGESVTKPSASTAWSVHDIRLLIQPKDHFVSNPQLSFLAGALEMICSAAKEDGTDVAPVKYQPPGRLLRWLGCPLVQRGTAELKFDWKEIRGFLAGATEQPERFDYKCAAFSADLGNRAVRVVFPLRGAKRVVVVHRDEPNAFWEIANLLSRENHSILTTHLSKGGAGPGTNTLIAALEPTQPIEPDEWQSSADNLSAKLGQLISESRPGVKIEVGAPRPYQHTLMPERRSTTEKLLQELENKMSSHAREPRLSDEGTNKLIRLTAEALRASPEYVQKSCGRIALELIPDVLTALAESNDEYAREARGKVIRSITANRQYANSLINVVERHAALRQRTHFHDKDRVTVMLGIVGNVEPRAIEQARAVLSQDNIRISEAHSLSNLLEAHCELDSCNACCLVMGYPSNEVAGNGKFSYLQLLSLAADSRVHIPILIAFDSSAVSFKIQPALPDHVTFEEFNPLAARPAPRGDDSTLQNWLSEFYASRSLPAIVHRWMQSTTVLQPLA